MMTWSDEAGRHHPLILTESVACVRVMMADEVDDTILFFAEFCDRVLIFFDPQGQVTRAAALQLPSALPWHTKAAMPWTCTACAW